VQLLADNCRAAPVSTRNRPRSFTVTLEQLYDVLQNLEFAIFCVYENEPDLLDLDVIDALDALVRRYVAEEQARTPPRLQLPQRARDVFEAAPAMCGWRLRRAALNEEDGQPSIPVGPRNTIAEILTCLKRVRKSVHVWSEQLGRQG
jgi:hypothetical protein